MKMDVEVNVNLKGLDKLIRGLSKKGYVKVGILGDDAGKMHEDSGKTNAEIGVVHEFGKKNNEKPHARSFLRFPIQHKSDVILKAIYKARKKIQHELTSGDIYYLLSLLGLKAEEVITQAFDTRGFGKWEALDDKTVARRKNKSNKPLVDTGELKGSISSKVVFDAK